MEETSRFAATVSQVHLGAAEEEIGSCLLPIATRLTLLTLPAHNKREETTVKAKQKTISKKSISSLTSMLTAFPHFGLDPYRLVGTETEVFIGTEIAAKASNKVLYGVTD